VLAESSDSCEESSLSMVGFFRESFFALAVVSAGLFADTLDPVAVIDALVAALVVLLLQPGSLTGCSCRSVLGLLAGEELVASAGVLRMKIFGRLRLLIVRYFVLAVLTLHNYRNDVPIGSILRNI